MLRRAAPAAVALALAVPGTGAQAALPGRDYNFSYFKDAGHSVLLDVSGRRSVTGIGFSISTGCVPAGTSTVGKSIPVTRGGRFTATRSLESVESGRTLGAVALRGRFTSAKRLVVRARFTHGSCRTREYRLVLAGSPPESD